MDFYIDSKRYLILFMAFFCLIPVSKSQSLIYSESSAIGPLNPYSSPTTTGNSERMFSLIYESLYRYDHNRREFEPVLARNKTNIGPNTYRVELRNDVRWHDGERFTAEDVEFTYQYIMETASSESVREFFSDAIENVTSTGEYTVEFTFNESVTDHRLYLDAWIIPSHMFDLESMTPISAQQNIARYPVGTGKYKFEDKSIGGVITLNVNSDHYFSDPVIQDVTMERIPDVDLRISRLLSGSSDLIIELPPSRIPQIETSDQYRLEPYQSYSITTIGFNLDRQLLQNQNLRQAMVYGTNREQILNQWYAGRGHLLAGPFTRNAPYYNPDLEPMEFDPDLAERLLENAGYEDRNGDGYVEDPSGNRLELQLLVKVAEGATQQVQQNVTQDFIEMMEDIGIQINVENLVEDDYWQELFETKNFDLAFIEWTFDPNYDISPLFYSEGGLNVTSYSNDEVDRLFRRFVETDDSPRRLQYMNRIQTTIAEDVPYIFMFSIQKHAVIHYRFVNTVIDPFYFFSDIDQWQIIE